MSLHKYLRRNPAIGLQHYARFISKEASEQPCKPPHQPKIPLANRQELKDAKRIMLKFGSEVIIHPGGNRLAMTRWANLIEQMADLQHDGKELICITSGAVAHGRKKLGGVLAQKEDRLDRKPAAAVGQPNLMYLYSTLFGKYNIQCAQLLISEADIYQDRNRKILRDVVNKLLSLRVIPIFNTNDAVLSQPDIPCPTLCKGIELKDNDSLAAILSSELQSDVLIVLSNVDGVYNKAPTESDARIIHTFSNETRKTVEIGQGSVSGIGGMDSKINAALWAVSHGTAVVVANGMKIDSIKSILSGKKVGTMFIDSSICQDDNTEKIASEARKQGRALSLVSADDRAACINKFAELLDARVPEIMEANRQDVDEAKKSGYASQMIGRLKITPEKIRALSVGIRQVAESSKHDLGKVLRKTLLAEGLELTQITVPIGVILVIFESRPDVMPQIAALTIASGNGLVLKGGDEAIKSNMVMKSIVDDALKTIKCDGAVGLVSTKEEIADLINMDQYIDLIIPRGGYQLIKYIQENSKRIPVMGHSEGICHIYVDKDALPEKIFKIIIDAKADYPTACNAVETILIHKDLMEGDLFSELCCRLKQVEVKINSGPKLAKFLQFGPPLAKSMKKEYGDKELCIEVVESMEEAIEHIHKYGSGHTESIITENTELAELFLKKIDSACTFHNASTRMSDGFRFGLGAEVGISTAKIHARGPVGIQGLLTTKWMLRSKSAHTAHEFNEENGPKWIHESLPID